MNDTGQQAVTPARKDGAAAARQEAAAAARKRAPAGTRADPPAGPAPAAPAADPATPDPPPNTTPIVIFVPGLGSSEANTADRIAEVIALAADRHDRGKRYNTETSNDVSAPRGLTVGKTITDPDAKEPVLQLFQFDYGAVLESPRKAATPSVAPGAVRAATYAVWALAKMVPASFRPAKTIRTKFQVLAAILGALALVLWAVVAAFSLMNALGIDLPGATPWLGTDDDAAVVIFGSVTGGLAITWAAVRKKVLALAETATRLIRFATNEERCADSITARLDQAIDDLRGGAWQGPLHLVGYSFGSLVLFEATHPREKSRISPRPLETVDSLTTIGCPLDIVRLFEPAYVAGRIARKPDLPWSNVFKEADIFSSNLKDGGDTADTGEAMTIGAAQGTATSLAYTDERISPFRIFATGRIHSGYWGEPADASCFEPLIDAWMAPQG